MAGNLFEEDGDFLVSVREQVAERDQLSARSLELREKIKKLKKEVQDTENSINNEIDSTIKKRRLELSSQFNRHYNENQSKLKKTSQARSKGKSVQVSDRIKEETEDLRKKNRKKEKSIRKLFKQEKVPLFCATKSYYNLFMPKGLNEIMKNIAMLGFIYLIVPSAITLMVRGIFLSGMNDKKRDIISVLVMAGTIILFILIYFVLYIETKVKYLEVLSDGRKIRDEIAENEKEIREIKKSIIKDRDESLYELSDYDKKLSELNKEAEEISNMKREALKNFDEITKKDIINEINGRRKPELLRLKEQRDELIDELKKTEKEYKEKSIYISTNYASYIGEEFCSQEKLDCLIQIMAEGQATNVSNAISYYKNPKAKE